MLHKAYNNCIKSKQLFPLQQSLTHSSLLISDYLFNANRLSIAEGHKLICETGFYLQRN